MPDDEALVDIAPGYRFGAWKVEGRVGAGGCGVVYAVVDAKGQRAALKVESTMTKRDDQLLKMEVHVLKQVLAVSTRHAAKLYASGKQDTYNFMIMQLLGPNLTERRRDTPQQHFTLSTALRLGQQCLLGLRDVHLAGFVHRDVKPSNYAMGTDDCRRVVYILDFGLARSWRSSAKSGRQALRTPRKNNVPFRGTLNYCSANVHRRREQGRHDDLWSFVYVLIEFIVGYLPWRNADEDGASHMKQTITLQDLFAGCPRGLRDIARMLSPMDYYSTPDYPAIEAVFAHELADKMVNMDEPFDWEAGGRFYHYRGGDGGGGNDHVYDVTDRTDRTNRMHEYSSHMPDVPGAPTAAKAGSKTAVRPVKSSSNTKSRDK